MLATGGLSLIDDLAGLEDSELTKGSQGGPPFTTKVDTRLHCYVVQTCRSSQEHRGDLLREFSEARKSPRYDLLRFPDFRPEVTLAYRSPLWRHPVIIHAALERAGAVPGTFGYAAAEHTLTEAAEIVLREAESRAAIDDALAFASLGLGIASFLPVVAPFARVGAGVVAAVHLARTASAAIEDRALRSALVTEAAQLGVGPPDAGGLAISILHDLGDLTPFMPTRGASLVARLIRLGGAAVDVSSVGASLYQVAVQPLVEDELARELDTMTWEAGQR